MIDFEFSKGQCGIIKDVIGIYKKACEANLSDINKGKLDELLSSVVSDKDFNLAGVNETSIRNSFEQDYFKHHDVLSDPNFLKQFDLLDLIIIKFILNEWAEDKQWNDLELANLVLKIDLLMDYKSQLS